MLKRSSEKKKIVLICDNVVRELAALELLKKALKSVLGADVTIVGSLGEVQRIYYLLYKLKPNIVFISQNQEDITRDIIKYLKTSGAIVCILPMELAYSRSNLSWFYNKRLSYRDYGDYFFLPGPQSFKDVVHYTNIP